MAKRRPKHVDVDKPTGWVKHKIKRWLRRLLKKETVNHAQTLTRD